MPQRASLFALPTARRANTTAARLVGLLVLVTVIFGLWVSGVAIRENVRLARLSEQILEIVLFARSMEITPTLEADRATQALLKSLTQMQGRAAPIMQGDTILGVPNVWEHSTYVRVFPASQQLKIETQIPYTACRKLLKLYANNMEPLGVTSIGIHDFTMKDQDQRWLRNDRVPTTKPLMPSEIRTGCGTAGTIVLGLSFRLEKSPKSP